jgi:hypothetical protein
MWNLLSLFLKTNNNGCCIYVCVSFLVDSGDIVNVGGDGLLLVARFSSCFSKLCVCPITMENCRGESPKKICTSLSLTFIYAEASFQDMSVVSLEDFINM